eukprot:TRINITY_DN23070_c0_g1_i3.p1 TRINITY_DN23070_c0_g1~~TRINITY_DN23070_c0_g1_i3.p1  ORF type:complete len:656 (+),score=140.92 TRINITY_DN23070_c0_g1_i3:149-2116(+)
MSLMVVEDVSDSVFCLLKKAKPRWREEELWKVHCKLGKVGVTDVDALGRVVADGSLNAMLSNAGERRLKGSTLSQLSYVTRPYRCHRAPAPPPLGGTEEDSEARSCHCGQCLNGPACCPSRKLSLVEARSASYTEAVAPRRLGPRSEELFVARSTMTRSSSDSTLLRKPAGGGSPLKQVGGSIAMSSSFAPPPRVSKQRRATGDALEDFEQAMAAMASPPAHRSAGSMQRPLMEASSSSSLSGKREKAPAGYATMVPPPVEGKGMRHDDDALEDLLRLAKGCVVSGRLPVAAIKAGMVGGSDAGGRSSSRRPPGIVPLQLGKVQEVEGEHDEEFAPPLEAEKAHALACVLSEARLLTPRRKLSLGLDAVDSEAGVSVHTASDDKRGFESCRWTPSDVSRRPSARNIDFEGDDIDAETGLPNSAQTVERLTDGLFGTWRGEADVGLALRTHEDGFLVQFDGLRRQLGQEAEEGTEPSTCASSTEAAARSPAPLHSIGKVDVLQAGDPLSEQTTTIGDSSLDSSPVAASHSRIHSVNANADWDSFKEDSTKSWSPIVTADKLKLAEAEHAPSQGGGRDGSEAPVAGKSRRARPVHVPLRTPRGTPIYVPKASVAPAADRGGHTDKIHNRRMRLVRMYNSGPSAIASAPLLPGTSGKA